MEELLAQMTPAAEAYMQQPSPEAAMQLIDMAAQSGNPELLMMVADTIASAVMSASGGGATAPMAPAPMAAEAQPMPPMGANGMRMPYYKSGGALKPQTALQKLVEKRRMATGGTIDPPKKKNRTEALLEAKQKGYKVTYDDNGVMKVTKPGDVTPGSKSVKMVSKPGAENPGAGKSNTIGVRRPPKATPGSEQAYAPYGKLPYVNEPEKLKRTANKIPLSDEPAKGRGYGKTGFTEGERARMRASGMSAADATKKLNDSGKSSYYTPAENQKFKELDNSPEGLKRRKNKLGR